MFAIWRLDPYFPILLWWYYILVSSSPTWASSLAILRDWCCWKMCRYHLLSQQWCLQKVKWLNFLSKLVHCKIMQASTLMYELNFDVDWSRNLYARGSPEQWLGNLEKAMFDTVKRILREGVVTYDSHSRSQWALDHPGQVVLTVVSYCIVCWPLYIYHWHACMIASKLIHVFFCNSLLLLNLFSVTAVSLSGCYALN